MPLDFLLHEDELPVVVAHRHHVAVVGEVQEPRPRVLLGLTGQVRRQVVTVDVHLVGLAVGLVAGLELVDHVGFAGGVHERGQPVM